MYIPWSAHTKKRKLEDMVENRTAYTIGNAELNVYETNKASERVSLTFNSPVLASMITGKKVMHLRDMPAFDFLPGESVIVPGNETMVIDFPEASLNRPTHCLALAISTEKIKETVSYLNETVHKAEPKDEWTFKNNNFHLTNDSAINMAVQRLIHVFIEQNKAKEALADLLLKELIIRLMQTEARTHLLNHLDSPQSSSHRLSATVQYIKEHIHEPLSIDGLAKFACMSQPSFFRCFKDWLGVTPTQFIMQERVKVAQQQLLELGVSVTDACFNTGFNNLNYFIKVFKQFTGKTPGEFKKGA